MGIGPNSSKIDANVLAKPLDNLSQIHAEINHESKHVDLIAIFESASPEANLIASNTKHR